MTCCAAALGAGLDSGGSRLPCSVCRAGAGVVARASLYSASGKTLNLTGLIFWTLTFFLHFDP